MVSMAGVRHGARTVAGMTSLHISDRQRRARLVARQHLASTAANLTEAVHDVVAMHSSDPTTPYLALWARVPGFEVAHLEDALYETRSLWRLHAMRRTLWIVEASEAATLEAAAGRKVAAAERKRVQAWVAQFAEEGEVDAWLVQARDDVLGALARAKGRHTTELAKKVPALDQKITMGNGKWAQQTPISSRLLFLLAMELDLVRGQPKGSWRSSQYRWERANSWFGDNLPVLETLEDQAGARARFARRYLAAFGPVMRDDLKWFMGWTVPETMEALAANGAVEARLDRRETGWVLPDDVDPVVEVEDTGTVAFLPGLDPTPMGFKERRFFLGPHGKPTFDDTGNIGPTVWVDGKVVGGWAAREDGRVAVQLLEDVGEDAEASITAEATRLTEWLEGAAVMSRFPSHLEKELREA